MARMQRPMGLDSGHTGDRRVGDRRIGMRADAETPRGHTAGRIRALAAADLIRKAKGPGGRRKPRSGAESGRTGDPRAVQTDS